MINNFINLDEKNETYFINFVNSLSISLKFYLV